MLVRLPIAVTALSASLLLSASNSSADASNFFPSLGTPVTIVEETDIYHAFPSLVVADNGDLVTVYLRAINHFSHSSEIMMTRSTDGGATWSTGVSVVPIADGKGANPGDLYKLANGNLVLIYRRDLIGHPFSFSGHYRESSDHGITWGQEMDFPSPPELAQGGAGGNWGGQIPVGRMLETSAGTLLVPAYGGPYSAPNDMVCGAHRSTDQGQSWTYVPIRNIPASTETSIIEVSNGTLIAFVRDNVSGLIRLTSTDDGLSWGNEVNISNAVHSYVTCRPDVFYDAGRRLILMSFRLLSAGLPAGLPTSWAVSRDEGMTWDYLGRVDNTIEQYLYGSFWPDVDGSYPFVYSREVTPTQALIAFDRVSFPPPPSPATFASWIDSFDLMGQHAEATANTDKDDTNLIGEFAFNRNPTLADTGLLSPTNQGGGSFFTVPAATANSIGMPHFSSIGSGANSRLRCEYNRRTAATSPELTYTVHFGNNPAAPTGPDAMAPATAVEAVTPIDAYWERVIVDDTATAGNARKRFGEVLVEFSPGE